MKEVDHDYPFEIVDTGNGEMMEVLPPCSKNADKLLVLPNGKLLPPGVYYFPEDDSTLIYEPIELSPRYDLLQEIDDPGYDDYNNYDPNKSWL